MAKDQIGNVEESNGKPLYNDVHYLEENAYLSKTVMALKDEIASLKETINILQKEKLEYAAQYNRLQNIVNNIDSTIRTIPSKLLELTDSTSSVLQLVKIASTLHMIDHNNLPSMIQEKISTLTSSSENKAHVVKPHMVNGHILHIPTITLTRLTDSYITQERNNKESTRVENTAEEYMARPSTSQNVNNNNNNENRENEECGQSSRSHNTKKERTNLYTIPELPESPSHSQSPETSSTVLSGMFQEVNIYQISDNRLNEIFNGRSEESSTSRVQVDENFIRSEVYKKAFLPTVNLTRLKRKSSPTKPNTSSKRNKNDEELSVPGTSRDPPKLRREKPMEVIKEDNNISNIGTVRRSSRIKKCLF